MQENNQIVYDDEIDLFGLFKKVNTAIARNKVAFFSIILIGLLVSAAIYFITPKRYAVRMLADSKVLSSKDVEEIISEVQTLIKDHNHRALSKKLYLSEGLISQIVKIEAEVTSENPASNNKDAFTITADILNPEITDSLQRGIIYYLENSDYVRSRINIQKENLLAVKKRTEKELLQLDSLKIAVQNVLKRGGGTFLMEPGTLNERSIALYEKILGIDESLKFLANIQVISGFDKPIIPFFPKFSFHLLTGLVAGLILAIVFVLTRKEK
jgi:primosomal protein N''